MVWWERFYWGQGLGSLDKSVLNIHHLILRKLKHKSWMVNRRLFTYPKYQYKKNFLTDVGQAVTAKLIVDLTGRARLRIMKY